MKPTERYRWQNGKKQMKKQAADYTYAVSIGTNKKQRTTMQKKKAVNRLFLFWIFQVSGERIQEKRSLILFVQNTQFYIKYIIIHNTA